jgi:hypothetical protein
MTMQAKTMKSPIVTISVCFPLQYTQLLDAYRDTEQFKPSRSKVFQTVMEKFLDESLMNMPHLAETIKNTAANVAENNPSVSVNEGTVARALAIVQEASHKSAAPAKATKATKATKAA